MTRQPGQYHVSSGRAWAKHYAKRALYSVYSALLYTPGVQYTAAPSHGAVSPSLARIRRSRMFSPGSESAELRPVQQASGNTRPGQSCRGQRGQLPGCCRRPLQLRQGRPRPAAGLVTARAAAARCSFVAVLKLDQSQALASTTVLILPEYIIQLC